MKILGRIIKVTDFEIEVNPVDKISDVKKAIETLHGALYPADDQQQMLIHKGKVLKDDSTLEENNVVEKSCILIMFSKPKGIIRKNPAEFLHLISEPVEGEKDFMEQLEDLVVSYQEVINNIG